MEAKKITIDEIKPSYKNIHEGYEYFKYDIVPSGSMKQMKCCVYEVPPLKANCPYHYHTSNEELFFILKGEAMIRLKDREERLKPGDFFVFPTGEEGAHKIYNPSETESLLYIDFNSYNEVDVAFYPDSNKVGVWDQNLRKVFKIDDSVDYYEGE